MSTSTSSPTAQTGFFDLPLELRLQIYTDCLPQNFNTTECQYTIPEPLDVTNLRNTDPRIDLELSAELRRKTNTIHYTVTSTPWTPPAPTTFPRLDKVEIEYQSYPVPDESIKRDNGIDMEISKDESERALAIMCRNLTKFVAWFKAGNDGPLEELVVQFGNPAAWDVRWSQLVMRDPLPFRESFRQLTTRTTEGGREVAVVETLLMPLKNFVVVEEACIYELPGVEWMFLMTASWDGLVSGYGREYMTSLFQTWEEWLQGHREGTIRGRFKRQLLEDCGVRLADVAKGMIPFSQMVAR